jgi:hypothetical protein
MDRALIYPANTKDTNRRVIGFEIRVATIHLADRAKLCGSFHGKEGNVFQPVLEVVFPLFYLPFRHGVFFAH